MCLTRREAQHFEDVEADVHSLLSVGFQVFLLAHLYVFKVIVYDNG